MLPLYIDTVKLHEIEVARSATRAHQDLKSKNPNIRIDLVLADKWWIETEFEGFIIMFVVLLVRIILLPGIRSDYLPKVLS